MILTIIQKSDIIVIVKKRGDKNVKLKKISKKG